MVHADTEFQCRQGGGPADENIENAQILSGFKIELIRFIVDLGRVLKRIPGTSECNDLFLRWGVCRPWRRLLSPV